MFTGIHTKQITAVTDAGMPWRWKISQILIGFICATVINSLIAGGALMWVESLEGWYEGFYFIVLLLFLPPSLFFLNIVGVVISVFRGSRWFALGAVLSVPVGLMLLIVIQFPMAFGL